MSGSGIIKIALIGYSQLMRECLESFLIQCGFSIVLSISGGMNLKNQIHQIPKGNEPDICILEWNKANTSKVAGFDINGYLHEKWPKIKIVWYSLEPGTPITEFTVLKAVAFLSKETSLAELK